MERKIEIALVPKERINEGESMIRITLVGDGLVAIGWGVDSTRCN